MPVVNVPLGTVRNFKNIEKWLEEIARCHVSFRVITQNLVTGKSHTCTYDVINKNLNTEVLKVISIKQASPALGKITMKYIF